MFNDFARPAEMWDLCLEMLHFAGYRDQGDDQTAAARELWDAALGEAAAEACAGEKENDADAAARAACAAAAALGPKLFPSDAAFPVAHVALRLELLAAGLWHPDCGDSQEGGEAVRSSQKRAGPRQLQDDALVAETVLRATRDSFEAAHAAYDRLLAAPHAMHRAHHDRRMQAHARHLQTPALRLRLLRSALRVLRRWEASTVEREPEPPRGFGAYGGGNRRARAPRSRTSARGTPARHAGCCRCPRASRAQPRRWRRSLRRWEGGSRRRDARTGTRRRARESGEIRFT
jgi:nuclear pore complex protein Nup155